MQVDKSSSLLIEPFGIETAVRLSAIIRRSVTFNRTFWN